MIRITRWTESIGGLTVTIGAIMFLLYGADKSLASLEQSELRSEAYDKYQSGNAHLAEGRAHEAISDLTRACALERNNREYGIALATAQIVDRQLEAADETLNDVLQRDSNDSRANLLMARIMAAQKQYAEADSYYHRAIYGSWVKDAEHSSVEARLELVDFLAQHGTPKELLADLLPLEGEAQINRGFARKLPGLFLRAGSLNRAEEAYRSLIKQQPDDVEAYSGLARAELISGNYQAAQLAFTDALRRKPGDPTLVQWRATSGKVMALDPTPRRLPSSEKYRRSMELLALTEDAVKSCVEGKEAPPSVQPLLDLADRLRGEKVKGFLPNELAEQRLDAAEKLWQARLKLCANPPEWNDALALVMQKLAQ
jgi:tetratricopeptide (TPR) repeat protein